MKKHVQIGMYFCVLTAYIGWGAISQSGQEFSPFGELSGHQQNPDIAIGDQGGFTVWQNSSMTSKGDRVIIHKLNILLEGEGGSIRLTADTDRTDEKFPRVALMPGGGAVVVWESGRRRERDVYIRLVGASNQYLTGVERVNGFKRGNQTKPDVDVNDRGDILVTWESEGQDGDGKGIYAQRYTPLGIRVGGEITVNQNIKWNQSNPTVAALTDGRFVIAWMGEADQGITTAGTPLMRCHVMGRMYDRQGTVIGNEFRLDGGQALCSSPRIVAQDGGGFEVAWTQRDEVVMTNLTDIHLRSFNKDGLPLGVSRRQNNYTEEVQQNIAMANVGGEVLMAWDCETRDGASSEVHGRLVSGGAEFQVNSKVINQQRMVAASGDGNGRAIVLWVDVVNHKNTTIKAQRFIAFGGGVDLAAGQSVAKGGIGPMRKPLVQKVDKKAATPGGQLEQQAESLKQEAIVKHESAVQEVAQIARNAAAKSAENALKNAAIRMSVRGTETGSINSPITENPSVMQTRQSITQLNSGAARLSMRPVAARASVAYRVQRNASQGVVGNVARSTVSPVGSMRTSMAASATLERSARVYSPTRQYVSSGRTSIARAATSNLSSAISRSGFTKANRAENNSAALTMANRQSAQQAMKEYARRRMVTAGGSRFSMRPVIRTNTRVNPTERGSTSRPVSGGAWTASQRAEAIREAASERAIEANAMRSVPIPATLERSSDRLNLRFNSQAGRRYVIQTSSDRTSWRNSGSVQRGTGTPMSVPVNPASNQRYMRVVPTN